MAENITILPSKRTGLQEFTEAAQPYLQMAFEYLMKKKLLEPEEKRKISEEQRAIEKEKREAISGVSKGEIPISTIPENVRNAIIRGAKINTAGLTGMTSEIQNLPPTAQIRGIPSFMQRVTPAETPEEAQQRLMSIYAQQQQAINPYKALQSEMLGAKQQINTLLEAGTPWENIPIQLKIMAGFAAKEGGGLNINLGGEVPSLQPISTPIPQPNIGLIEVTNPQGKKVKIKNSDLENALKQGYKK